MLAAALCLFCLLNARADSTDDEAMVPGEDCNGSSREIALDSQLGSAGFMKNMAEHPESIRVVAEKLLTAALQTPEFEAPRNCGDSGRGSLQPLVVYRVEPTVVLPEHEQQPLCLTLEKRTKSNPIRFDAKQFESVEKLNEWVMAFSQGRGDDGKALYEQCGGNCSPRYTFDIAKEADILTITADVLCGLARDKKSDQYLISTVVRRQCADHNKHR